MADQDLIQLEKKLLERQEKLEKDKEGFEADKKKLEEKKKEYSEKLQKASGLTAEEAREELLKQIEEKAEEVCNCEKKKKGINLISHCVQKHNFQEIGKNLINNSLIINYWKVRVQAYANQDYAVEVKEKKKEYLSEGSIQSYFQHLINIPNFNIAKTSPYNLMKKSELRDLGSSWMNRRAGG